MAGFAIEFSNETVENINETRLIDPIDDLFPGSIHMATALLAVAWWLTTMFAYFPNPARADPPEADLGSLPVVWAWSNLGHSTMGWMARAMIAYYILDAISVVETIAFVLYWNGSPDFMFSYFPVVGFWGRTTTTVPVR